MFLQIVCACWAVKCYVNLQGQQQQQQIASTPARQPVSYIRVCTYLHFRYPTNSHAHSHTNQMRRLRLWIAFHIALYYICIHYFRSAAALSSPCIHAFLRPLAALTTHLRLFQVLATSFPYINVSCSVGSTDFCACPVQVHHVFRLL